jgi:hypothetical protein
VGGNLFQKKDRWEWWGFECEFVDDVGVFVATRPVITCDPKETILHNQLGKDHVGFNILYCSNNGSIMMTIWKWPLFQTHVPTVNDEGQIGVRKK